MNFCGFLFTPDVPGYLYYLQCGYSSRSQVQISANNALFIYIVHNKNTGVLQFTIHRVIFLTGPP